MHTHLIGILAIVLYLFAGVLLALRMLRRGEDVLLGRKGVLLLGLVAAAGHAWALAPMLFPPSGINLGFFNALSLIALLSALLLLISSFDRPLENLGIVLLPFAALSVALMFAYPSRQLVSDSNWQLDLHILISMLAYSLFAIAAIQAILLAIQDHQLHNRRPGGLIRALPPLQTMESLLMQLIATGFVLLSIALVTGFLFIEDIFAQHLVHKTVLSLLAWVVFATLLWGRWRFGWRGRVAIRWTLGGYLVLMLAYFGSKLVLELVLQQ
ncbi:cytochrome c biogenesis protein CcsA [Thiohalobacter sp. IOR34]|uniref:cytochrome C assembly family protein n=1 Tax=Thiohalobacter sp. IOR34 TaxID=3057176 RepID=UPI0025B10B8C|nr:cytochrome c biogenesis protein CcsA [Thiohalobacter sp. IOR34]WJW74781.1 cytochrome c biogenesis protein CcsA [Thiohalobacter sp. IOR34]